MYGWLETIVTWDQGYLAIAWVIKTNKQLIAEQRNLWESEKWVMDCTFGNNKKLQDRYCDVWVAFGNKAGPYLPR